MSIGGIGDGNIPGAISSGIDNVTQGLSKAISAQGAPIIADAIQVFGSAAKTAFDEAATAAGAKPNVGAPGYLEQPLEFFGKLLSGKAQDLSRALSDGGLSLNEKIATALGKTLENMHQEITKRTEKLNHPGPDTNVEQETQELKNLVQQFDMLKKMMNDTVNSIGQAQSGRARKM